MVDDADQHLGHDRAAHRPEPLAAGAQLGLLEDVVPERRLPLPAGDADLVARERVDPERGRDGLAGRQPGGQPALQVAHGERAELGLVHLARDLGRQPDQRRDEPPVDRLGALRRGRAARQVEELAPVDLALGGHGPEADQVREQRERLAARPQAVGVADLAVAIAEGAVGELDRQRRRVGRVEPAPAAVAHRAASSSPTSRGR